jgi:uncharacterized membrane protein
MGSSSEVGMHGHMSGILWFMEIGSVVFVLAVFVFYFMLKRRIKKKKTTVAAPSEDKKASGE